MATHSVYPDPLHQARLTCVVFQLLLQLLYACFCCARLRALLHKRVLLPARLHTQRLHLAFELQDASLLCLQAANGIAQVDEAAVVVALQVSKSGSELNL
jgi:hypothetical protein